MRRLGHNKTNSKTYRAWAAMVQRCRNQNDVSYANYGGRGIEVCQEWLIFKNFLQDMGEAPDWACLDRVDNDGNYCKANCRWTNGTESRRNTSRRKITQEHLAELRAAQALWQGPLSHLASRFARAHDLNFETVYAALRNRSWA